MWPFTKKKEPGPSVLMGLSEEQTELLSAAHEVVDAFVDYIGEDAPAGEIRDISFLPAPKAAIANAFVICLTVEQDPQQRASLLHLGLLIPNFQDGIGSHPLRMFPVNSTEGIDPERLVDLVAAHKSEFDRFSALMPQVNAERRALAEKFDASIAIAERLSHN